MQIFRKKVLIILRYLVCCFILIIVTNNIINNIQYKTHCNVDPNTFFDVNYLIMRTKFDRSANYKTVTYVTTGTDWEVLAKHPLCIALHCSLDHLHYLTDFISNWSGPISIVVFAPGIELPLTLQYINYLTSCYPSIKRQVSFHLTIMAEDKKEVDIDISTWDCEDKPVDVLKNLLNLRSNETIIQRKTIMFPGNLLRNIARNTCQSPWLMNLDIDMVLPRPTNEVQPSITEQLLRFLKSETANKCNKCAFVLPIFEISSNVTLLPSTKGELLSLVDQNLARTFYSVRYGPSQKPTEQTTKWSKLPTNNKEIYVAYQASYMLQYEPLYIAKKGAPNFDERYLQRGMDRETQTYEMHLADYTYNILDNIFLCHLGFKVSSKDPSFHVTSLTRSNVMMFQKHWHRELAAKYDKDPLNLLKHYKQIHSLNHTVKMRL